MLKCIGFSMKPVLMHDRAHGDRTKSCTYIVGVGCIPGIQLYHGIALIPFQYIFVCLSYRKPDSDYTVK